MSFCVFNADIRVYASALRFIPWLPIFFAHQFVLNTSFLIAKFISKYTNTFNEILT